MNPNNTNTTSQPDGCADCSGATGSAPSLDMAVNLLRMAVCPNCDGSGAVMRQVSCRQYVSRDMAMDAGDLSMEGALYCDDEFEPEQCQWCYERDALISALPNTKSSQPGQ